MKVIKSILETNIQSARKLLIDAAEMQYDAVIVLGFNSQKQEFDIKNSKIHQRLELIGALREAEHHLILGGDKK